MSTEVLICETCGEGTIVNWDPDNGEYYCTCCGCPFPNDPAKTDLTALISKAEKV